VAWWGRPYQTWRNSPTRLSPLVWGGAANLNRHNFGCMAASDSLFDSRDRFSGRNYPMKTAEIEGVRDVAMATNFGNTLAANGLWREITTWGFRIKDSLFSVHLLVALSGFVVTAIGIASGGRLSGWELNHNCQHSSFSFFFPSTDFSTSLGRFSRNSATRRGVSWNSLSPVGVFICPP